MISPPSLWLREAGKAKASEPVQGSCSVNQTQAFRKGALHSGKSQHPTWDVMDQTRLCGLETLAGKGDV